MGEVLLENRDFRIVKLPSGNYAIDTRKHFEGDPQSPSYLIFESSVGIVDWEGARSIKPEKIPIEMRRELGKVLKKENPNHTILRYCV